MTEHERIAVEAAHAWWLRNTGPYRQGAFEAGWEARAKYEPPAVCGAPRPQFDTYRCELEQDHPGDHRRGLYPEGVYVGWPRT